LIEYPAGVPGLFETVCLWLAFLRMNCHGQGVYLIVRTSFVIGRVIAFTVRARLCQTNKLVWFLGIYTLAVNMIGL
jgi:hypothetical protein